MAYFASVAAFSINAATSGCARKKGRVAARKFNDLRLGSLRHESLKVRIDHSVLHGNYGVLGFCFQAATVAFAFNASPETGTWDIAIKRATGSGASAAKSHFKPRSVTQMSVRP